MRTVALRTFSLVATGLLVCGCASPPTARYVYQDHEFGVIAIPSNTYLGKIDYRAQAETLMSRHFPEGHEIVRAEEVPAGQRFLDLAKKTEIDAAPNLLAASDWIKLGKVGRSTSYEQKDQVELRECRIIYRRKAATVTDETHGFAKVASLTAGLYLDPNEFIRHQHDTAILAKGGTTSNHSNDHDTQLALSPAVR